MPPSPTPENVPLPPEVVTQRKSFSLTKILIVVFVVIGVIAVGYGIFAAMGLFALYQGADDAASANEVLNQQVAQTPDTLVATHACVSGPYSWVILQKDRVYAQTLGGAPGRIYTYRALALTRNGQTIAESDYVNDLAEKRSNYVPAGYSKVYVVDESVLEKDESYGQVRQITITRSAVPPSDFESIAQCLRNNADQINTELKAESEEYFFRPIGWVLYENASH